MYKERCIRQRSILRVLFRDQNKQVSQEYLTNLREFRCSIMEETFNIST